MGISTDIGWTDATVNPWWGCQRVSPACQHCYAEGLARRVGKPDLWGGAGSGRWLRVDAAIRELDQVARQSEREGRARKVFLSSMADLFEDRADLEQPRLKIWAALHRIGKRIQPQILTKRPEIMAAWAAQHGWPEGAWAGTTAEDQVWADRRIPALLSVPAPVRFLSVEPMLGAVDLRPYLAGIGWVICGGEGGAGARPMSAAWARSLRDQCIEARVPFFFKQWGDWIPEEQAQYLPAAVRDLRARTVEAHGGTCLRYGKGATGNILDGAVWEQFPVDAR